MIDKDKMRSNSGPSYSFSELFFGLVLPRSRGTHITGLFFTSHHLRLSMTRSIHI